jgi:hypothetical protein
MSKSRPGFRDLMSVLYECQQKRWIKDARVIQPQIESIHFALVHVIPDDCTSEADISGEFE